MAPPKPLAVLPLKTESVMDSFEPLRTLTAPPRKPVFWVKLVEPEISTFAPSIKTAPPAVSVAVEVWLLESKVEFVMTVSFSMTTAPPFIAAVFFVKVDPLIVLASSLFSVSAPPDVEVVWFSNV